MIDMIRITNPKAFLYGFTMQHDEPKNGLDTSLNLSGTHRILSFQFKRPKKQNKNIFWFDFNNSTHFHQHNIMHVTANATSPIPTVFYALPAYFSMNDFENSSPNFLQHTYFIDILETPLIFDLHTHSFEIDVTKLTYSIHSDNNLGEGKIQTWDSIHKKFLAGEIGISTSLFKRRILEFQIKNYRISEVDNKNKSKVFLKALVV